MTTYSIAELQSRAEIKETDLIKYRSTLPLESVQRIFDTLRDRGFKYLKEGKRPTAYVEFYKAFQVGIALGQRIKQPEQTARIKRRLEQVTNALEKLQAVLDTNTDENCAPNQNGSQISAKTQQEIQRKNDENPLSFIDNRLSTLQEQNSATYVAFITPEELKKVCDTYRNIRKTVVLLDFRSGADFEIGAKVLDPQPFAHDNKSLSALENKHQVLHVVHIPKELLECGQTLSQIVENMSVGTRSQLRTCLPAGELVALADGSDATRGQLVAQTPLFVLHAALTLAREPNWTRMMNLELDRKLKMRFTQNRILWTCRLLEVDASIRILKNLDTKIYEAITHFFTVDYPDLDQMLAEASQLDVSTAVSPLKIGAPQSIPDEPVEYPSIVDFGSHDWRKVGSNEIGQRERRVDERPAGIGKEIGHKVPQIPDRSTKPKVSAYTAATPEITAADEKIDQTNVIENDVEEFDRKNDISSSLPEVDRSAKPPDSLLSRLGETELKQEELKSDWNEIGKKFQEFGVDIGASDAQAQPDISAETVETENKQLPAAARPEQPPSLRLAGGARKPKPESISGSRSGSGSNSAASADESVSTAASKMSISDVMGPRQMKSRPVIDRLCKPDFGPRPVPDAKKSELCELSMKTTQQILNSAKTKRRKSGQPQLGLVGIYNMGNTCYMAACIQMLSHTKPVADYFLNGAYLDCLNLYLEKFGTLNNSGFGTSINAPVRRDNPLAPLQGGLSATFSGLLRALWCSDEGEICHIYPRFWQVLFSRLCPSFADPRIQQDAHEYYTEMLDRLHEENNLVTDRRSVTQFHDASSQEKSLAAAAERCWRQARMYRSRSRIYDIFQGQMVTLIECMTCGFASSTFDTFTQLNVELPNPAAMSACDLLRDCIQQFFCTEILRAQWRCERCQARRDARKSLRLWRPPPVLVIQLKRFDPVVQYAYQKNDISVYYPLAGLDLSSSAHAESNGRMPSYELYSVMCHRGQISSGHYTAMCRTAATGGNWVRFNDEQCERISEAQVQTPLAYMLCYTSKNWYA